jgi:hypothetical protein
LKQSLDISGKQILGPYPQSAGFEYEFDTCGLARVPDLSRPHFIDLRGRAFYTPRSMVVSKFNDGIACAFDLVTELRGFVNTKFEWVVPPKYEETLSMLSGYASVRHNGKWGMIDRQNNVILPCEYESSGHFSIPRGGLIMYSKMTQSGRKYGYMTPRGDIVISLRFEGAWDFVDGFAVVSDS